MIKLKRVNREGQMLAPVSEFPVIFISQISMVGIRVTLPLVDVWTAKRAS